MLKDIVLALFGLAVAGGCMPPDAPPVRTAVQGACIRNCQGLYNQCRATAAHISVCNKNLDGCYRTCSAE